MNATPAEINCIRYAANCKLKAMRRAQLEEQREFKDGMCRNSVDVSECWHDRIAWFLFSPIAALFIYIILPIGNWIEYSLATRREIREMGSYHDLPEAKTLSDLWSAYGLDCSNPQYTMADFSSCLSSWVDNLYGRGTAQTLNLGKLVSDAYAAHTPRSHQITSSTANGERLLAIICYSHPADQIVRRLNDELPPYA